MRPDESIKLLSESVKFWMLQEGTKAEYARHQAKQAYAAKEEQKKQFSALLEARTHETENALQQQARLASENEELKAEVQLLQEKHQESQRTVRLLQEAVVELKRKRGESPLHSSDALDEDTSIGGTSALVTIFFNRSTLFDNRSNSA